MRDCVESAGKTPITVVRDKRQRHLVTRAEDGDMRGQGARNLLRLGALRVDRGDAELWGTIVHRFRSLTLLLALCAAAIAGVNTASVCHAATPIATIADGALVPLDRVTEYRAVFESCSGSAGEKRLAVRRMFFDGAARLLTVDPITLVTRLDDAGAWSCVPTDDAAQGETRFGKALRGAPSGTPNAGLLRNEGVMHGLTDGSFVTGDLCPSLRPLDRAFLERFEQTSAHAPIALSISGLWLVHHADDFHWLQQQRRSGALNITWVTHSFTHPFDPQRPMAQDFLLRPGLDLAHEVLDPERLLIAQGETPSVFFRFPGLVANAALVAVVRAYHLIALGADAWLVLSPTLPRPGSIILVHPNGNEPAGLRLFARYLDSGRLSRPFRPVTDAP